MEKREKVINIDLTNNETFNKYLDEMVKSNKKGKRLAIVIAVVVLLLLSLLLLIENM